MNFENRYQRQQEIVTGQSKPIAIIGTGAVGRQVAIQAAAMGMSKIYLIDFDIVSEVNLSAQGFFEADLGNLKTEAIRDLLKKINSQIEVVSISKAYKKDLFDAEIVFSCVDGIDTRKKIFNAEGKKGTCKLLIDSRMTAEFVQLYRCDFTSDKSISLYRKSFFNKKEAFQDRCTSKTTIYCANITAGLMIAEMTRHMRGFHVLDECQFNILAGEYTVTRPA